MSLLEEEAAVLDASGEVKLLFLHKLLSVDASGEVYIELMEFFCFQLLG